LSSSLAPYLFPTIWQNFLLSTGIVVLFALLAIPKHGMPENFFARVERLLATLARRSLLASVALFFLVVTLRVALLRVLHVPIPGIHDEFSYLLMGDTFAHGRLTNSSHPLWRSFETFHVNWLPTYSSIYPPAQGAVLALGQVFGNPWIGVLLSNAAMCVAIYWMLRGWMPSRWALLGAALVALKLGIASYWMNSYWGGAVAAIGGALVLGALPRIRRQPRVRDALLLAAGVAILANSRPYEGALLCLPVAVWLACWIVGSGHLKVPLRTRLRVVLAPVAAVLICTASFMAFYNWRATGHPQLFPYTLNLRTYVTAPIFLWQQAKPALHYNNQQFEDFYNGWERIDYQRTATGIREVSFLKWTRFESVFFWPAAALLIPGLLLAMGDKRVRFLWVAFVVVTVGIFAVVWSNPHYAAPLTGVIFALLVQAMRHLRVWRPSGRPIGMGISRAIVLLLVLQIGDDLHARRCDELDWTCGGDSSRAAIQQRLSSLPGKQLVIVRYEMDHNIHDEWVFNGAEIDNAKVLWARELDAAQNAALVRYFHDRTIWLVNPDADNLELIPYGEAAAPSPPSPLNGVTR
jgi:hypothetical protein